MWCNQFARLPGEVYDLGLIPGHSSEVFRSHGRNQVINHQIIAKHIILYTDAYDITIGCGFSAKGTLYTYGKYCGTTNDEIMRYVRCTNFMNALFVQIAPFSTAGMPRGNG